MNIVIPWQHNYHEVKEWLHENAGQYRRDWAVYSQWVGYEEAGALEHTLRVEDDAVATAFLLRWGR